MLRASMEGGDARKVKSKPTWSAFSVPAQARACMVIDERESGISLCRVSGLRT
jgi:hypothetical protein